MPKEVADNLIPMLVFIVGACALYFAVPDEDDVVAAPRKDTINCPICRVQIRPDVPHEH